MQNTGVVHKNKNDQAAVEGWLTVTLSCTIEYLHFNACTCLLHNASKLCLSRAAGTHIVYAPYFWDACSGVVLWPC
jgi:hypothetical protein